MSKENLKRICQLARTPNYIWSMYFFKVDKRSKQPYRTNKIRFKNGQYLTQYITSLVDVVEKFQIEPISQVQPYDGENTKTTCDKLSLDDKLIAEQWGNFTIAVGAASDEKIAGKVNGYIVYGEPVHDMDKPITFVKIANPIIQLANKRSVAFTTTANDELDLMADDLCRLYLTADFITYDGALYTFNHTFENMFGLEKTMTKVKNSAIDVIANCGAFADKDMFKAFALKYKSPRTFITLRSERIDRMKDAKGRQEVADMLNLDTNEAGNIICKNEEETSLLIRYLCFKIFRDKDSEDLLEASTVSKLTFV